VKELLKSVHICQSYRKNKSGTFFNGPRPTTNTLTFYILFLSFHVVFLFVLVPVSANGLGISRGFTMFQNKYYTGTAVAPVTAAMTTKQLIIGVTYGGYAYPPLSGVGGTVPPLFGRVNGVIEKITATFPHPALT